MSTLSFERTQLKWENALYILSGFLMLGLILLLFSGLRMPVQPSSGFESRMALVQDSTKQPAADSSKTDSASLTEGVVAKKQTMVAWPLLDLSAAPFYEKNSVVSITGKAALFPSQLLEPQSVTAMMADTQSWTYAMIPATWEGTMWHGKPLPAHGYGTYVLRIKLPKDSPKLGFLVPNIWNSHRIWMNGVLVSQAGRPDTTLARTEAQILTKVVPIPTQNSEIVVVIQTADFLLSLGGLAEAPWVGPLDQIESSRSQQNIFNLLVIGGLLLMSIYHLLIYFFRRKERSMFYFGLVSLVVALRFSVFGQHALYEYLNLYSGFFNMSIQIKTYYACTFALIPLGLFYLNDLFPKDVRFGLVRWYTYAIIAYLIVGIALPTELFTRTLDFSQAVLALGVVYVVVIIILAAIRRRPYANYVFLGLAFMLLMGVHDAVQFAGVNLVTDAELLTVGFLGFLFVQFFTLSRRFSTAFNDIEDLTQNLEIKVQQRTEQLSEANAEIQNRNRVLESANEKIAKQREELQEKNQDITDSIEYARRIQLSILPRTELLERHFPNSFVLYMPKDIVSGDFYWFHESGSMFYFCVADCTGHGVPGAFMSVLGINLLNELVNQETQPEPSTLLNRLNFRVREALKQNTQSRDGSQDGMDMALFRYDTQTKELLYAGANRPFWLWREGQLQEHAPTKMPIGGTGIGDNMTTGFAQEKVQLQSGDNLYAFTDGITDQFGGENKRKFSSKRLRELLEQMNHLPAMDRRIALQGSVESWMIDSSQTDDIQLLSIRI
jgi:serine phosphatase RsbU (regulator of sigma subunit)